MGVVAALPIWTDFMGNALKGTPEAWVSLDSKAKAPQRELNQMNAEPKQGIIVLHRHWHDHCIDLHLLRQYVRLSVILMIYQARRY